MPLHKREDSQLSKILPPSLLSFFFPLYILLWFPIVYHYLCQILVNVDAQVKEFK
jgi:hypothetical protein